MKPLIPILLLVMCAAGCSSDQPGKADTTDASTIAAAQPAEVKPAATSDDALLMAEYLVFTHLADSLIYKPVNDTAALLRLVSQIDMTAPNYSTNMMHATLTYLHGVFSDALLPMQLFAGKTRTPEIKRMADEFNNQLQQVSNTYLRAVQTLEQKVDDTARASQMQQVAMLLQGNNMTAARLRFDQGSRSAFAAAHRVLGR